MRFQTHSGVESLATRRGLSCSVTQSETQDALVVVVDVKLPYPGGSTAYYDAVGQCNVLIAKAIQDAGAELCLPTSRRVDIKKDPQAPKGS